MSERARSLPFPQLEVEFFTATADKEQGWYFRVNEGKWQGPFNYIEALAIGFDEALEGPCGPPEAFRP